MNYNAMLTASAAPVIVGQFDGHMLNINPGATLPAGTVGPIRFVGDPRAPSTAGWTNMHGIASPQFSTLFLNPNQYHVTSNARVFYRTRAPILFSPTVP